MNPLLKKLQLKPERKACVLQAPTELESLAVEASAGTALKGSFDWILFFARNKAELTREAPRLKKALNEGGMVWIAYPKAKALGTDLNRDIVRELLAPGGLETVAQVALDDTWSALRCKAVGA